VVVAPENLPSQLASDFAAVSLYPLAEIGTTVLDPSQVEGYIMAYRHWLPNPAQTIGVRMTDDAMHPILPIGSIAAIDRSMTNPLLLHGRIVAACPGGVPIIRWLEVSGRHMILRPNQQGREYSLMPVDLEDPGSALILGQVVWSWSRFSDS
jgi:SOS-response transcriptional repressor LexA